MKIDSKDKQILDAFKASGKLPIQELADLVSLSLSATSRRVQRLEDDGFILGYTVEVNEKKLGLNLAVFIEIALRQQTDEAFDQFEAAVKINPAIKTCHLMSGEYDYLIHALVPDAEGFEQLHRKFLSKLPFVDRIKSSFAIRRIQTTQQQ
jgi:Lrp/AsnC family leucine-responsive transcriptional regulator